MMVAYYRSILVANNNGIICFPPSFYLVFFHPLSFLFHKYILFSLIHASYFKSSKFSSNVVTAA